MCCLYLVPCALCSVIFFVFWQNCRDYRYFIRMPHRSPFIVYRAIQHMDRPMNARMYIVYMYNVHWIECWIRAPYMEHCFSRSSFAYFEFVHAALALDYTYTQHTAHNIHINILIYMSHTHCHSFHGSFCIIFTLNGLPTFYIDSVECKTFYTVLDSTFNILHSTFPFAPHT